MWISKKFKYRSLEEVHQIIKKVIPHGVEYEVIPIFQACNRVLAEDIISDVDIPPFSISHVDGYAVRAEDTLKASIDNPILLKVIGRIYPGEKYKGEIKTKETVYISTGCRLPIGSDAVIPVEMTRCKGNFIEIRHSIRSYENVTPVGIDIKKGERLFNTGHVLRAQDIKLLADIKKWKVKVFKKPSVALLSVGDELTDQIEETDKKKFDSHKVMISSLIEEVGGIPLDLGIASDDINSIKKLLKIGLKRANIVVTIGGASVGEKDYVWDAINQLSAPKIAVRGIKIQPGRVTSLVILNDKPIVLLPGHIQSTVAGFYMVLLPLIQHLSGIPSIPRYMTLSAKMSQEIIVKEFKSFKRIRFVKISKAFHDYIAEPVMVGDSSLISVLVKSDGFIVISEGKETIKKGEKVDVHLFKGLPL